MADELDRLFRRLVEVLRERRAGDVATPFTVRELYREWVPYARVRTPLDFRSHADYEIALLRLLAGERRYLHCDLPDLREACARELREPIPDRGVYRRYEESRVRVDPLRAAEIPDSGTPAA